ncbi:MAG: restriction endonuclease subunit S [Candidatus Aegiribacteria sp.]|nr:restriction endonuclease subunit S [Candidatus Aegiribacteria sp.]
MTDRNAHRPGYKKTNVGWIPEEWQCLRLRDLVQLQRGFDLPHSKRRKGVVPIIASNGIVGFHSTHRAKALGVVTGRSGSIGNVAFIETDFWPLNTTLFVTDFKGNDPLFSYYFLIQFKLERFANGTGVPTLNRNDIHPKQIPIPPFPEQKKIAEILSTWDEAIEQTRKLIEAKKRCKKALMQQLLTGKKRLLGKNHQRSGIESESMDWGWPKTKDLFKRHSKKPAFNEAVLSVTQDNGVVLRESLDRRIDFKQTNTGSYKLVSPGDFIISLRSFQGGIEYSSVQGVVSPAYHVIRASKNIEPLFYKYYFKSKDFIKHLAVAIIGIRDGKQVSYEEFSAMPIPHPPIQEQRAIADVLSFADSEIKALDEKLSALKKQKRGLMQKLLTGEVRVRV